MANSMNLGHGKNYSIQLADVITLKWCLEKSRIRETLNLGDGQNRTKTVKTGQKRIEMDGNCHKRT